MNDPATLETIHSKFHLLSWLAYLRNLSPSMLLLVLAAGVIFLLYGRVVFKTVVILNAALLAGYVGWHLGQMVEHPRLLAAGSAIVVGLLAWPLLELGVACITGLVGAVIAVSVFSMVMPQYQPYTPIVAGVGFVLFAFLGWFLFQPAVMAFTAFQGASMIVLTAVTLLDRFGPKVWNVQWWAVSHSLAVAALIVALTVLGVAYQGRFTPVGPRGSASTQQTTQSDM